MGFLFFQRDVSDPEAKHRRRRRQQRRKGGGRGGDGRSIQMLSENNVITALKKEDIKPPPRAIRPDESVLTPLLIVSHLLAVQLLHGGEKIHLCSIIGKTYDSSDNTRLRRIGVSEHDR